MYFCIYVYEYIYIYCLLPIAYVPLRRLAVETGMWKLWKPWRLLRWCLDSRLEQFMRHGHEMLWFSRGSFSESELPLSYNAFLKNTRARADAINWLRDQPFEQGMIIYI